MAAAAAAREWDEAHPRNTVDLVGHAAAEAQLLEAWGSGRLPHAWLICGPTGIGKATLAYRFARFLFAQGAAAPALFAERPVDLSVSADDPVFRRVASGGHADLCTIERAESERTKRLSTMIRVEQVRQVTGFFGLTAGEGGWRVAIVDGADQMNPNAANALLKVLEEPPPRGLLLLVAHARNRLLPTVRSRCRTLVLRPLPETAVAEVLARRLPELAEEDRAALARLSEGSPGRALALAAQGGLAAYHEMVGLLAQLPRLDLARLHALSDRLARRDQEAAYRTWIDLTGLWLTRLVRAGIGAGEAEVVAGEAALNARLAESGSLDRWVELWEKINHLAARADRVHLDRKQVVLSAFLALEQVARG